MADRPFFRPRYNRPPPEPVQRPLAGALTQEKAEEQGVMLANRVWKIWQHLAPRFKKQQIGAFRLFDRDIPEIRAVVDAYVPEGESAPHLVLSEYERLQTETVEDWLGTVALAIGRKMELPDARIHLKRRRTGGASRGYDRRERREILHLIREGERLFTVNLDDFLDTGLFADHRITRNLVASESKGRKFLNLFAYTGSFSVAAGLGGALSLTTVDGNPNYIDWARANLRKNGIEGAHHRLVVAEVREWIYRHQQERWDLIVCDPPSFSQRPDADPWDVLQDHPTLLREVLALLNPGGVLWFSTNHQRFVPHFSGLPAEITERTAETVPADYRNRQVHQCWRMVKH